MSNSNFDKKTYQIRDYSQLSKLDYVCNSRLRIIRIWTKYYNYLIVKFEP